MTTVRLGHSGDTWFECEHLPMPFVVEFYLARLMWSWSYETHIPNEDIPELWKFVNRVFFDESADTRLSGIVLDFIERTISSIVICFE